MDMKHEEAEDGVEGIGDRWRLFVTLLQAVWESGTVPTQMTWMISSFFRKGEATIAVLAYSTPFERLWRKKW